MTPRVTFRSVKDSLKIRIKIHGQKPASYSTGIYCPADKFDAKKQISGFPKVQTYMESTTEAIRKMYMPGASAETLWNDLVKQRTIAQGTHKVVDAFDYYLRTADVTESTKDTIRGLKDKLETAGLLEALITDLNGAVIRQFLNDLNLKDSTTYQVEVRLRTVLNLYLSDNGIDTKLPKMMFKKPKVSEEAEYLTWDELSKLLAIEVEDEGDRYGKDLWCLMALTGLAISDLLKFDPAKNISEDGKWLHYNRKKTDSKCTIPLLPMAKEIISRHKWPAKVSVRWIQYKSTGIVSDLVGKKMKSHSARKTAGCVFLELGMSMESVGKILGHTSIRTTETVYARVTQAKIEREMNAIPDKIKAMMV